MSESEDGGARPDAAPALEQELIQQCADHWFVQGGQAEFGALTLASENADGLIAAILRCVRTHVAAQLAVAQAERDQIRVLCTEAGITEESTTLDYLRGVFYQLKSAQAERDQLRDGHLRLSETRAEKVSGTLRERLSWLIELLVHEKEEQIAIVRATGAEKDALRATAEAEKARASESMHRAQRLVLENELSEQLRKSETDRAALAARVQALAQRFDQTQGVILPTLNNEVFRAAWVREEVRALTATIKGG